MGSRACWGADDGTVTSTGSFRCALLAINGALARCWSAIRATREFLPSPKTSCRLLLERGVSLKLRDLSYDSTGVGWADFSIRRAQRDRLFQGPDICLLDALEYDRLDRVADNLARDPPALERPLAARHHDGRTLSQVARDGGFAEFAEPLQQHGTPE